MQPGSAAAAPASAATLRAPTSPQRTGAAIPGGRHWLPAPLVTHRALLLGDASRHRARLIGYSARAALIGGNAGCLLPASFRRQLHRALPPGAPPSLTADWLSGKVSSSHWWKTNSGGRFPDAAGGPGRASAGSVMAVPLRDRLSFLSRVQTGAFGGCGGAAGV